MKNIIKVGIIGATGYTGNELIKLLLNHKNVKIEWYASKHYINKQYYKIYQNMFKLIYNKCINYNNIENLANNVDIIFMATPNNLSSTILNEKILSKTKIIDLSADFRFKNIKIYEKWYNNKHKSQILNRKFIYGLCELNRSYIKKTNFVANPGCYTTCSILSCYPLIKDKLIIPETIIIDAKSGSSGSGKNVNINNLYCEVNENIKPYEIATHRHIPEIEEQLNYIYGKKFYLNFIPHLIPMCRGILVTIYASLNRNNINYDTIRKIYKKYYDKEYFIRILDKNIFPQTKYVNRSNFIDINFKIDHRTNRIIIIGAIDNLIKGAAGQAIQNMNIMFGFNETEGLKLIPTL